MDYTRLGREELLELLKDLNKAILANRSAESRVVLDLQAHQVELEMQNRELRDSRRQLEDALALYSDLYDSAPIGYMTLDRTGRIIRLNLTAASMLIDRRENAVSIPFVSFLEKEEAGKFYGLMRECRASGRKASAEFTLTPRKRPRSHAHLIAEPYVTGEGVLFRVCLMDVTGIKAVEEKNEALKRELLLAQRMELAGRLSGGLIHDFNNVMTVISSYANLAAGLADETRSTYLDGIRDASGRALALLRQLHILNGSRVDEPEIFNMNSLIPDAASMVSRIRGANCLMSSRLGENTPEIERCRGSFEQLLLSILLLARQCGAAGEEISISTQKSLVDGQTFASLKVSFCSDGGHELEKVIREALLEYPGSPKLPNSSLKAIRSIADGLGAKIELGGEEKIELTFHIPAFEAADEPSIQPDLPEAGICRRILLVEDEKHLRKSMALVLSRNGYSVVEAADANEAEEIFTKEEGRFDILLTDLVLKGENGLKLSEKLLGLNPGLQVLFTSGCLDIDREWPEFRRERRQFIQKPFEIPDLLATLARCLAPRSL